MFLMVMVAMLVIALVDPRPLIGLAIAVITPLTNGTIAIVSSEASGVLVHIPLPAITAFAIFAVSMREHSSAD